MAESSAAGAKRARRGAAAPAQPRQRPPREIRYSAPLVVPPADAQPVPQGQRVLVDHTLLQFAPDSLELTEMVKLAQLEPLQHRTFDRDLIGQLGRGEEFDEIVAEPWRRLLECPWAQFDELTVEFLSTLRYDARVLSDPSAVSFALGRTTYSMSVAQFAVRMGIYTEEEVDSPVFTDSLRGVSRHPHPSMMTEEEIEVFWRSIATAPYTDRRLASQIRDPLYRYLHRVIACTIIPRHSGKDKCSYFDLFCLFCLVGRHPANLATILLTSLGRSRRGGPSARLDMGPYVGRLARRLDVHRTFPQRLLTIGPQTTPYTLHDMRLAGMCPFDEPPRWEPIREAVLPLEPPPRPQPSTHRIPHRGERPPRDEPQRPPPAPPRITVQVLWERVLRNEQMLEMILVHLGLPIPPLPRPQPEPRAASDSEPEDAGDE